MLSEHRGSSRHSTTTVRQPGQALAIVCRSFRAGRILIFKTQGSASLHLGLRSITPSAFSQVLPPENALIADCFYAKQILRDKSRRRAPFPNLWGKSSALDPTPPFAKWQTHIKFSIFRVDLGAAPPTVNGRFGDPADQSWHRENGRLGTRPRQGGTFYIAITFALFGRRGGGY